MLTKKIFLVSLMLVFIATLSDGRPGHHRHHHHHHHRHHHHHHHHHDKKANVATSNGDSGTEVVEDLNGTPKVADEPTKEVKTDGKKEESLPTPEDTPDKPESVELGGQTEAQNPKSATLKTPEDSSLEQHKLPASTKPTAETTPENPQADNPPDISGTQNNTATAEESNSTATNVSINSATNTHSNGLAVKGTQKAGSSNVSQAMGTTKSSLQTATTQAVGKSQTSLTTGLPGVGTPTVNITGTEVDEDSEVGMAQGAAKPFAPPGEDNDKLTETQALRNLQNYQKDKVRSSVNSAPALSSAPLNGKKKGNIEAQRYLTTANAAVDAAAEAVADAAALDGKRGAISLFSYRAKTPDEILKLHHISDKGELMEGNKKATVKYFRAASEAVAAAHEALANAAKEAGFEDLPGPNIVPLDKEKKKEDPAKAREYIMAANGAVNAAERALDNLAAAGFPEIVPSMSITQKKTGISQTKTASSEEDDGDSHASGSGAWDSNANRRLELQNQFIEVANKAVYAAHTAIAQIQKSDEMDRKSKTLAFMKSPMQERRFKENLHTFKHLNDAAR